MTRRRSKPPRWRYRVLDKETGAAPPGDRWTRAADFAEVKDACPDELVEVQRRAGGERSGWRYVAYAVVLPDRLVYRSTDPPAVLLTRIGFTR